MGMYTDMFLGRNFVVVTRPSIPDTAETYRPNHTKILGEAIYIPAEVREELGLRVL